MDLKSFTTLDFETFTAERSSACEIGLVKVIEGNIVKKFSSLIKPIPDDCSRNNSSIHGITEEMLEYAPAFNEIWPTIKDFIGQDLIICHNAPFDKSVLEALISHYDINFQTRMRFLCTLDLTGKPLKECCEEYHIQQGVHHDALDDAIACAKIWLSYWGHKHYSVLKAGLKDIISMKDGKKYDRATLDPIADEEVTDQSTPFFHAKTVITGTFSAYPNRNDLGKLLQSLGADMNTAISKKTNIVVMGVGAGPSKVKKIEELKASGVDIRIIYESELINILGK